jgi:hypothetical protein
MLCIMYSCSARNIYSWNLFYYRPILIASIYDTNRGSSLLITKHLVRLDVIVRCIRTET